MICKYGYPGSFRALFPLNLNLKTPNTASSGNIPSEKPMYTSICSNVPDKTSTMAIVLCNKIAPTGTLNLGCIFAAKAKK